MHSDSDEYVDSDNPEWAQPDERGRKRRRSSDKWKRNVSKKKRNQEHLCYASAEEETPDSRFPHMYHTLIHSPALDTMLNLEHTYAVAVGDMVRERDETLGRLQKRSRTPLGPLGVPAASTCSRRVRVLFHDA
ncbi:hypothetical protein HPB47_024524 [Ixodes persulcatus]|uniref:Uncharacterized protein n=1 Tax=Ixodes persulcatus TaxID=34615 RepID=A0AC60Q489_IXOPE|nr:hypothetical protein HPB47_024524 [Ixodes persulcatus]